MVCGVAAIYRSRISPSVGEVRTKGVVRKSFSLVSMS
jgi:hypothetical protein